MQKTSVRLEVLKYFQNLLSACGGFFLVRSESSRDLSDFPEKNKNFLNKNSHLPVCPHCFFYFLLKNPLVLFRFTWYLFIS